MNEKLSDNLYDYKFSLSIIQSIRSDELFHEILKELQITMVMSAMEESPGTRVSNNKSLSEQRAFRQKKEETTKQHNLGKASDQYIDALIYYEMGNSEACWNIVAEVIAGLKKIVYQKDKFKALKDNIQICYKGYVWDSWKTSWSHAGIGKSVPELTQVLKDLIKKQRAEKLKNRTNQWFLFPITRLCLSWVHHQIRYRDLMRQL